MTLAATFKYTFPIIKSEQRADGKYVVGYASGPEIDSEGERMSPDLIGRFASQINDTTGDALVYRDAHAPDGVLRDLGVITKAWVNEHFHLGIEVKLDDDNPASAYLWKQLDKGKQYGMSVSGRVLDYTYDMVDGFTKPVRTYKDVVLDEISNTTRPAWYPSFGSVLSKSVKDAASAAPDKEGTEVDPEKDTTLPAGTEDATEKSEEVVETTEDTTSKADESTDDAGEQVEQADESAEKADESTSDEDVDKAGRSISNATGAKLLSLYTEMTTTLADLGLLGESSEKSDSEDVEDTLDKSAEETADDGLAALQAQVEALAKANAEQAARIVELEKAPRTQLPGVITDETKKSQESDLADLLSKASPSDRLRLAFALQTQGR